MEQILKIAGFIINSFVHIWPYLIITIPLAVAVQLSGASRFINKALSKKPLVSIFLATVVGAFSPFCSCGVIPVISTLLIGGVPLAPVMSFWIASPSMDPEIFLLSTATIGWNLSVWRLASTFVISLLSGFITHFAFQKGVLGKEILRKNNNSATDKPFKLPFSEIANLFRSLKRIIVPAKTITVQLLPVEQKESNKRMNCCISVEDNGQQPVSEKSVQGNTCGGNEMCEPRQVSFQRRLLNETWKASFMVAKFMTLAFLVNALIQFYVPKDFIPKLLGENGQFSVLVAALTGIPVYTSNITALPLISGLLALGMNQGAALAFLVSGPTTTLPAMAAVWGIVNRRIFMLYISFALFGAILTGLLFNFIS